MSKTLLLLLLVEVLLLLVVDISSVNAMASSSQPTVGIRRRKTDLHGVMYAGVRTSTGTKRSEMVHFLMAMCRIYVNKPLRKHDFNHFS